MTVFDRAGFVILPASPARQEWVQCALPFARAALSDPALADWYQCENTWFVGVDALPNDTVGRLGQGPALAEACPELSALVGCVPALHRAQLSVVFPGYPKPRKGESAAGFRYRSRRDAAHVDGILAIGSRRRRMVQEPHAFILGLPLNETPAAAAPLVAWEGSHRIMQDSFVAAFSGAEATRLSEVDVTDIYQSARRRVFETCPRRILHAPPGAAILLHRMTLHGVAPWEEAAAKTADARMIAYFRPPMPGGVAAWVRGS